MIEARSLRRRQVLAAFLRGGESRSEPSGELTRRGFVLGIALSLAIAVVVGIAGLVDASRQRQRHP